MTDRATMAEQRRALDEMIVRIIREGAHRFSIISGRVPSAMTGGICGPHWRAVDHSLQRLRKAGRIVCHGNVWSVVEEEDPMADRTEDQLAVGVRDGTVPSELVGGEWVTPGEYEPDATVTYAGDGWVWWARGRMGQARTYDEARMAAERALKGGADA